MTKFYRTKEFLCLQALWKEQLAKDGFEDIEDDRENLKQHDKRTIAWQNQDRIRTFFFALDAYLTDTWEVPLIHRHILELYSKGTHITVICRQVQKSRSTVKGIISHYKKLILAQMN